MPHVENGQIVETAIEARGGLLGRPVLVMLVSGTAAVIVLFAVVYMYFFA